MVMIRKKKIPDDNNEEAEMNEVVSCFLCREIVKSSEYSKHLEKQHGVIFGVKEIIKAGEKGENSPQNEEPDHETGEAEPEIVWTDADTVKELVEMKYLTRKRKIRLRNPIQTFIGRNQHILSSSPLRLHVYLSPPSLRRSWSTL